MESPPSKLESQKQSEEPSNLTDVAPERSELKLASFFRRSSAYFLDNFFLTVFTFSVAALGTRLNNLNLYDLSVTELSDLILMIWALQTAAFLGYFSLLTGGSGRTIGKILMNIEVVRLDGLRMTYKLGILRSVGYLIGAFFLYLGFLWAVIDSRNQALHDKMAGTVVVEIS